MLRIYLMMVLALAAFGARAQDLEVDVVGGRDVAAPIAVVPFSGGQGGEIASIIRNDLARSGQFKPTPEANLPGRPTTASEIDFAAFAAAGQQLVLIGRASGGLSVEYELFDVGTRQRLLGFSKSGPGSAQRDIAHQIADDVYQKVTGTRGAFWTRIAYISVSGTGKSSKYALMVADADGHNARAVANANAPLMSPSWSPDGSKIAYVSFESGNSAIYVQDLGSGGRQQVTSFAGINSAPAFSPDGSQLAMSLSKDGNPEIYVADAGGGNLRRLTNQGGIDTSPAWSADGRTIYFTSDRSGPPQLYQMPAGGGAASRLSFSGGYNADATTSRDGNKLAAVQGGGNSYRIAVADRSLGNVRWSVVSPGQLDEAPSLSPNGAMVVYAGREGGRGTLKVVSSDGRVTETLPASGGDLRDPAWSNYREQR